MAARASYWLAQKSVLTVGADNMAWDVSGAWDPELGCFLPGHLILLARQGIYIVENLQLDELGAAKAYRFTFVCTPLKSGHRLSGKAPGAHSREPLSRGARK